MERMTLRHREVAASVVGYIAAVAGLVLARAIFRLAPDLQFLAAAGVGVGAGLGATWWLVGLSRILARPGGVRWKAVRGLVIFLLVTGVLTIRALMADDWPIVVMAVVVPPTIAVLHVLQWASLEPDTPRAKPRDVV